MTAAESPLPNQSAPPAAPEAPTGPVSVGKRWTRKRTIFAAVFGVLLIVALFAGYSAWRVFNTMGLINERTTPPPIVSGAVLGGSPDVQIDTGPAQTALALASLTATATPSAVATGTAQATGTATVIGTIPNITADVTTVATSTPSPTPTATPVLSEIERVKNGSFEDGLDPWYSDNTVAVVPDADAPDGGSVLQVQTGGYVDQSVFFVAGTSYVLTVQGKVDKKGDSGQVGVVYIDANENRITAGVPKPITFKKTRYTTGTMTFTPPDGVAKVNVFVFKEDSKANQRGNFQVDNISIRSVVADYDENGKSISTPRTSTHAITILVMGVDAREDGSASESIDGQIRPDSLMVVHLDPDTKSCRVLSVPRDSRTDLPGYGLTKINHALAVGGIPYEEQVVSSFLGIPIDHYVLIDFNGFEDLVNALGGVTIDVPEGFTASNNMVFEAGVQGMNGKQALTYARYRGDNEGDFGRIKRQQQVIRAVIAQTGGLDIVSSFNELLPAIGNNFRTDLGLQEMINLAQTYRSICSDDSITLLSLEGEIATFQDPLLNMPLSYVVVDEAEIRKKVSELLEP